MALPADIQQIIDAALTSVQNHPKGELAQSYRRQIYDALWDQYADVCKWWSILAARRVQSIYECNWRKLIKEETQTLADVDMRFIIRSVANNHLSVLENLYYLRPDAQRDYAKRMLDICEDVMTGLLVPIYAQKACSGYYYEVESWSFQQDAPDDTFFAFSAAHRTLCTVAGSKPLDYPVGDYVDNPESASDVLWSTEWDDLKLVQEGGYAADAGAYAAYAFAYEPKTKDYDPQKLREFWQWWLTEAIQQAWEKQTKEIE